jgi:hypothetical protein
MDQALSSTTRAKDCLAGAGLLLSPNQNPDQISPSRPRGGVSFRSGGACGSATEKERPTKWPLRHLGCSSVITNEMA